MYPNCVTSNLRHTYLYVSGRECLDQLDTSDYTGKWQRFLCISKGGVYTYPSAFCSPVKLNTYIINVWPSPCAEAQWERLSCLKGRISFHLRPEHTLVCGRVTWFNRVKRKKQYRGILHLCIAKKILGLRRDYGLQLQLQGKLEFENLRALLKCQRLEKISNDTGKAGLSWRLLGLLETLDTSHILSALLLKQTPLVLW